MGFWGFSSSKESCTAATRAASNLSRRFHGNACRFCPSPPNKTPPSNSKCFHRGDFSSAPATAALTHASRLSFRGPPYDVICSSLSSFCMTAMVAVLKTLIIWRQSNRLRERSQIVGTVNSCDARRLTFSGLPSKDKKLAAFGRRLFHRVIALAGSDFGGRTWRSHEKAS